MYRSVIFLSVILCAILVSLCGAEELPLWEAGVGITGLSIPDYRGSDEYRGYFLPLPYLVYRGQTLRVDRKGMYGLLFESERVVLNISGDLGVPVNSGKNSARTGMPNLDPAGQIGPSLEVCLFSKCDADRVVQFRLPVRAVVATNLSRFTGIGFVANPQLNFDFKNIGPGGGWNFGFALGPLFATERYHDYYYQVSPQYAIPDIRPSYDAKAGYSGSVLVLALSKRFDHFWFGAFARYDELTGAVFENSPLMKTRHSFMGGFGFAWVFGQSKTLVQASP
jgi:outer membrane protein